ncbi:MAG: alcohol dehydrogenase catalytic domain-containing protein [bacterium]|nr:alcohol dehydrogenase catalytic domain-containing protein [bacterium]
MRAAVYHPPDKILLEERPQPQIDQDEILLKVRACGICGTDVLKVNRALPKGPIVLGHEVVGEAVAVGKAVTKFKVGDRIVVAHHVPCGSCHYCRHGNHSMCHHFKKTNLDPGGFSEYLRIPGEHVEQTAFLVPESISDDVALFTEPLSCCIRNIRRSHLLAGDTVVIVGMGSIGLMTLQLLKRIPVQVLATDLKDDRLELAKTLGADEVLRGNDPGLPNKIQEMTEGRGADLVILTAGGPKVYESSFRWIRDGGALNLFASLSEEPIATPIETIFHHEVTVFSSYSPSPEDLVEAHRLLLGGEIQVEPLITHHLDLGELNQGIELINRQEALKVVIRP